MTALDGIAEEMSGGEPAPRPERHGHLRDVQLQDVQLQDGSTAKAQTDDVQNHDVPAPAVLVQPPPQWNQQDAANKIANLERALESARTIGAAVGILMERHKVTRDAALAALVRASQQSHRKLRDIAEHLVNTGSFDWPPG